MSMNLSLVSQTVKQNKGNCVQLMEQTHGILNAIAIVCIESNTGGELPPSDLKHIGIVTEYVIFRDKTALPLNCCLQDPPQDPHIR
jgi:hypothetical protein